MKITFERSYAAFTERAVYSGIGDVWIPKQFVINWKPNENKPPQTVECELPDWFIKKYLSINILIREQSDNAGDMIQDEQDAYFDNFCQENNI